MKKLSIFLFIAACIIGCVAVTQYFYYAGPGIARKSQIQADMEQLELDKEKLLVTAETVEEMLRARTTTNFYFFGTSVLVLLIVGFGGIYIWKTFDERNESWHRAVDGMFALQKQKSGGITWRIDPNKTFSSSIGIADSGEIAELPVADNVGSERQLTYNKNVQTTRTAIAISGEQGGFKYAATGKFLAGAYDKPMLSKKSGEDDYSLVPPEPIPVMSLQTAWNETVKDEWIMGQSQIDGEKAIINLKKSIHLAIIGAPGVGKTASSGLLLAAYAARNNYIVICLDGKGGVDWTQYNKFFEVQETNETIFIQQWKEIAKEHNRRLQLLRDNGWKTIEESNGKVQPVLLILEEFGALLLNIMSTDMELYKRVLNSVTSLMKVSRTTGIHVCIIDQTLADCPSEIKAIIKTYIAYKLNGGIGNAVKLYYLDKLADNGEFCFSSKPDNKFKAWYVPGTFNDLKVSARNWSLLPENANQEVSQLTTDFDTKKSKAKNELANKATDKPKELSENERIINAYTELQSLNKTAEIVFGKGKRGKFYADKVKSVLISAGVYDEKSE